MALQDLDPTSPFDLETLRRAIGGFYESPATARETALRQQSQEQDFALDATRRLLGLQTEAQERIIGAQGREQRGLTEQRLAADPTAQLTQGVMQGLDLQGPLLSNLMQIISGRYGSGMLGRQLTADAAGQRQKMALMQNVMADYQRQLAKLDPNDPNYETQVQALDTILNRRLNMIGAGGAAESDPLSMLRSMMGAPAARAGTLPAGSAAPPGFEGYPLEFLQGDIFRSADAGARAEMSARQAAIEQAIADAFGAVTP